MLYALFHQYLDLVGFGTGTIAIVERYNLVIKPALALDIGINHLKPELPCFDLDAGYQFKIASTARTIAYFRPGLAAVDIEAYDIFISLCYRPGQPHATRLNNRQQIFHPG